MMARAVRSSQCQGGRRGCAKSVVGSNRSVMTAPQETSSTVHEIRPFSRPTAVLKAPSFKGKSRFQGHERGNFFPASRGECHRSLFSSHHIILLSIFGARPIGSFVITLSHASSTPYSPSRQWYTSTAKQAFAATDLAIQIHSSSCSLLLHSGHTLCNPSERRTHLR